MKAYPQFWQYNASYLLSELHSRSTGLTDEEAKLRATSITVKSSFIRSFFHEVMVFLKQYSNPLILLLIFAAVLSGILKEYSDALIILGVLVMMGTFSYLQERFATKAVQKLQARMRNLSTVIRNGKPKEVFVHEVVAGDIVELNAGDIIPADGLLLEVNDLHVNESMLTGESLPTEKNVTPLTHPVRINNATNAVFKGTSVVNGTARFLAVHPSPLSEFDRISSRLTSPDRKNAFEKGITNFGRLILRMTIIICAAILIVNIFLDKPLINSLLFSLAIAVGLAPELLPAIFTVTMAAGAKKMAAKSVIVKKLDAILNLGQMDILCCDKTGTITEGTVNLQDYVNYKGDSNESVKRYGYLNAFYESGFNNPIDEALRSLTGIDNSGMQKKDEIPYDFSRKRLSVVVQNGDTYTMITKGAFKSIVSICSEVQVNNNDNVSIDDVRDILEATYDKYNSEGARCIAVSIKNVNSKPIINKTDECEMLFAGLLIFEDQLKAGINTSIDAIKQYGISLKLISGDNAVAVTHIAKKIGIQPDRIICGEELGRLGTEALRHAVTRYDIFAETEPFQKEFIIKALQDNGHTVGFLGDGINDAPALKASDAGISVDTAVDVARDSATIVLLNKDLDVLLDGIKEGRKTFVNIQKYIFLTTSANFGNMLSMALFSIVIPFLPLLPTQILLNNFLSDVPTLALAKDRVDESLIHKPSAWNIKNIKRFMIVYGLQSSLFDFITFIILLRILRVSPPAFRTAWFLESLLTEILIIYVIRSKQSVFRSMPSRLLIVLSAVVILFAFILPYLPSLDVFAMVVLPTSVIAIILGISLAYSASSEMLKKKYLYL